MATYTADAFVVRDRFPLARDEEPVTTRVRRDEACAVHVTDARGHLLQHLAAQIGDAATVAFIVDERVETLYGAELLRFARDCGSEVVACTVPSGEASKSLARAATLLDQLAASELARRDLVVCFGGGVVADLGGWVASSYMRGIPYVNVPTTLLAMVDGALGGKLAVNHATAKNLIGGFRQPAAVLADVTYLRSLDRRHIAAGLAECIKKGVIASPAYFGFIEDHVDRLLAGDARATTVLVRSAAAIKTALIERDPYELDLRRPLNFGHTVGHPVETVMGYGTLLHGEAVAFGMVVEAAIAVQRGWLAPGLFERLVSLLATCGLPTRSADLPAALDVVALRRAMHKVRLIRAGSLRWVLPVALGESVIADDVTDAEVAAALAARGVQ
jgi:3-dehydroquinate synthase